MTRRKRERGKNTNEGEKGMKRKRRKGMKGVNIKRKREWKIKEEKKGKSG